MPSQFFGLNISYSGLLASNAALNTTANNISNVDTEGYSRQQTVTRSADAMRVFAKYGCTGAGVDTLAIERLKNQFYDDRYRKNETSFGEYEVKQEYMKTLENYFIDDEYTIGFNTIFGRMFDSLQEVMKNAGDTTYKQAFVKDAASLAEYFGSMNASLLTLQKDVNAQIYSTVDAINSYGSEIATLTKQINVIEIGGGTANELRDERDLIVDKLSELVTVEAVEAPIIDNNNPERVTGATSFTVKIAGGDILCKDFVSNELICTARNSYEAVNQSDADGLYDIKWSNGNNFDLNNRTMGGKLKGLVDMRDGNNGEYFHGKVGSNIGTYTDADGIVHQTATVEVNADYLKEINKCTVPECGYITLGDGKYYYDSFSFEYDESTGLYSYKFILSDGTRNSEALGTGACGDDAYIGLSNSYQGIPYYMEQMNEWVRDFAQASNEIITVTDSVDGYGHSGRNLFVADGIDGNQYTCGGYSSEDLTHSYSISCTDNSYYRMTADTLEIDKLISMDAGYLATRTVKSDGQDKYDIVEKLIDLQTNKEKMSFRGCTASEFLQCLLSDVALNANSANSFSSKYEDLGDQINTMRMSISSVDKDEEAVNLVKFQNAYVLASKMISCFTEIYDQLILSTGV